MKSKSQNPAFPDAHPTAPGGMSRAALIDELVNRHGYDDDADAWAQVRWPVLIDLVVAGRLEARDGLPVEGEEVDVTRDYTLDREGYDHDSGEELSEDSDPNPGLFKSAHKMFDDEGSDTAAADLMEQAGELLDALLPLLEDIAAETETAAGSSDDSVLDPEKMFAEMAAAREASTPPPLFIGLPVVKDYIFDGHAGAGPSGAERWMNCTMSLTAARKFLETLTPNQQHQFAGGGTGKSAARQGTTAHAAAEVEANHILGRVDQAEVDQTLLELAIMPDDEGEAYDEEMADYINEYTDLVRSYALERGDDAVLIESGVEAAIGLTDLHEGETYVIRGSADLAVLPTKAEPVLVVGDLKYGNGLDVDVESNPQIRIYALGVLALLMDAKGNLPGWLDSVTYHIIQPRLGGIKTWSESVDDLLTWRDETLAPALTKALYGHGEGATYEPSDLACQWCPARGSCPALTEQRVSEAADLFGVITEAEFADGPGSFPETTSLSDARLGELLSMAEGLKDITKDLKEEAQRRLHRGTDVPGYQLVSYTPPRKWAEGATEALDALPVWTEPKLVTPTQALELLKKDPAALATVTPLVVAPDKRPVIAKVGDRRKKWEGKPPEQLFPDVSQTGEQA